MYWLIFLAYRNDSVLLTKYILSSILPSSLSVLKRDLFVCCVVKGLELKGQMVYCPESDSILFVGSPFLNGLESLTGRGLFISDIPLHDATRDVVLVGEQARAQVTLAQLQYAHYGSLHSWLLRLQY